MNLERVAVATTIESIGGVLTDADSRVLALWASFSYQDNKEHRTGEFGIPVQLLHDIVDDLQHGRDPVFWDLGVELGIVTLAEARNHGLSAAAAKWPFILRNRKWLSGAPHLAVGVSAYAMSLKNRADNPGHFGSVPGQITEEAAKHLIVLGATNIAKGYLAP